MPYDELFTLDTLQAATYIFTDIERLPAWDRRLAAEYYRGLKALGLRCLNDPARVMTRYPLLFALHAAGFNPFRAWRVDGDVPTPRFPVFLRFEADHGRPLSGLLHSANALAAEILSLQMSGLPLVDVLAIEFCAQEIAPGAWRKHGTYRIGDRVLTVQAVVEDDWCVKYGKAGFATDQMFVEEHDVIARNAFAGAIAPAFDIAAIEWGRADHATVDGREVVYEINTNPGVGIATVTHRSELHLAAERLGRQAIAEALAEIDTPVGADVCFVPSHWITGHRARCVAVNTYQP